METLFWGENIHVSDAASREIVQALKASSLLTHMGGHPNKTSNHNIQKYIERKKLLCLPPVHKTLRIKWIQSASG